LYQNIEIEYENVFAGKIEIIESKIIKFIQLDLLNKIVSQP